MSDKILKANIFDIQRNSFVDGPGIRTTVFFKGCNLRCAWCHNPESQSSLPEILFYQNKCIGCGRCKDIQIGDPDFFCYNDARELCGKDYTCDELLSIILKDKAFYETSGGGVTLSGGECMLQPDAVRELLKKCKNCGIHTAIDTAGHISYGRFEEILPFADLFLYDIKCIDPHKHKAYTGVGNELILENLKRLLSSSARLWIRIPVIPNVNDSEEEMRAIKAFLDSAGSPEKVELLPYHAMGEHKYAALGRSFSVFSPPDEEKMETLRGIFL